MLASRPRLCGLGILSHNLEDPIQLGFAQQFALVVFGSHIVIICPTRFAMVLFLVSFFGSTVEPLLYHHPQNHIGVVV